MRLVRTVGVLSVLLAVAGWVRPGALARAAGVVAPDSPSLRVPVRFAAARQGVLGLALLTRSSIGLRRPALLFLPLTALDCAAAAAGVRAGTLRPRAVALSAGVLAANAAAAVAAR